MTIFSQILFIIFLLFSPFAKALTFDMIAPGADGDNESAQPVLREFYDYLKNRTGLDWQGTYHNDADDALAALRHSNTDLAIMSPIFQNQQATKLSVSSFLKTIPVYNSEPVEFYHLLAGPKTAPHSATITVMASSEQEKLSLRALFPDQTNLHTKKITASPQLIQNLNAVATGTASNLILLSGYEFSVIETLKSSLPEFQKLKLIATSAPQPSARVVLINPKLSTVDLNKLKAALLNMNKDQQGQAILKKLRLKGFVEN